MLCQVIVGSVSDTPQLTPAEGEQKLNVRRRFGIEGKLFRIMVAYAHLLFLHAQAL